MIDHLICCLAPAEGVTTAHCGTPVECEPAVEGECYRPDCVVCLDLDRTGFCPHDVDGCLGGGL